MPDASPLHLPDVVPSPNESTHQRNGRITICGAKRRSACRRRRSSVQNRSQRRQRCGAQWRCAWRVRVQRDIDVASHSFEHQPARFRCCPYFRYSTFALALLVHRSARCHRAKHATRRNGRAERIRFFTDPRLSTHACCAVFRRRVTPFRRPPVVRPWSPAQPRRPSRSGDAARVTPPCSLHTAAASHQQSTSPSNRATPPFHGATAGAPSDDDRSPLCAMPDAREKRPSSGIFYTRRQRCLSITLFADSYFLWRSLSFQIRLLRCHMSAMFDVLD